MFRKLKNILLKLIHPNLVLRNHPEDKLIDEWFSKQLENCKFELSYPYDRKDLISGRACTILLNGSTIWINNRYYASPKLYDLSIRERTLPYPDTTIKFFKELDKFIDSEKKKIFKDI